MGKGRVAWLGAVGLALALVACAGNEPTAATGSSSAVGTSEAGATSTSSAAATASGDCPGPVGGSPWRDDGSVALAQISSQDGVEVYAAEYPLPGPTEGLWSQWGQGIALGDGRHLSAVGDHLGVDGNSFFFVYDSGSRTLTRFADVLSTVPHDNGSFGYGKVHAQMVRDRCGIVWATTYWGTRDDLTYEEGYEGDRLLAIDTDGMTIGDHGAIAGEFGMPTMTITADGTTLVAGSVDVESGDEDHGVLTVFDAIGREVVRQVDDPRQIGFRALGIDPAGGGVFYSVGDGGLGLINPASDEVGDLGVALPGDWLRAVTRPAPDGTVYGASDDDPVLFSISADGSLEELGDPGGTTTSLAMTPDGSRVFWMPEAHGGAWEIGAPIMGLDTATGEITEVVSLIDSFEEALGLLPGGTYSAVYDDGRLILGVNASPLDDDSGFGTVVLVVIEGL